MNKSTGLSLLFFFIFLMGVLGIVLLVNQTLNRRAVTEFQSFHPDDPAPQQLVSVKS